MDRPLICALVLFLRYSKILIKHCCFLQYLQLVPPIRMSYAIRYIKRRMVDKLSSDFDEAFKCDI